MDQWDKNAPVITESTPRSKDDPHEILLGHDEVSEDETAGDLTHEKGKK